MGETLPEPDQALCENRIRKRLLFRKWLWEFYAGIPRESERQKEICQTPKLVWMAAAKYHKQHIIQPDLRLWASRML